MTRQDFAVHWRLICVLPRVWIESLSGQIGTLYLQFTILPYLHVYSQAKINNLSPFSPNLYETKQNGFKKDILCSSFIYVPEL